MNSKYYKNIHSFLISKSKFQGSHHYRGGLNFELEFYNFGRLFRFFIAKFVILVS